MKYVTVTEGTMTTVTLHSPPANALSTEVVMELRQVLQGIKSQQKAKVVFLHGEGKFFSAGADISEFVNVENKEEAEKISEQGQLLMAEMEALPIPVVAVIHGAALGGGLELAMAAHIRFVSNHAKLGLPESKLGLIPGFAGTQRLSRLVGHAKALELMLSGEPVSGTDAVALGLVNQAFPEEDLFDEARAFCEKVTSKSKNSIEAIMALLPYTTPADYEAGIEREKALFREVFVADDGREGVQAFLEKRQPNFKDQ